MLHPHQQPPACASTEFKTTQRAFQRRGNECFFSMEAIKPISHLFACHRVPCFLRARGHACHFYAAGWLRSCTLLFTLLCLRSASAELQSAVRLLKRGLCGERADLRSDASRAHRYRLLLLALLRQVLDAVDEELVGADVGPASFYHPTAQLHQLEEETKIITLKVQQESILFTAFT